MLGVEHGATAAALNVWGVVLTVVGTTFVALLGWIGRQLWAWTRQTDRQLQRLHEMVDSWHSDMKSLTWDVAASRTRIESLERDRDRFHPRTSVREP